MAKHRLRRQRFLRLPASLIVIASVWLVWPGSVSAVEVRYEPADGKPGTRITISGTICVYQLGEQLWFSDRFVPPQPDGQTIFEPVAIVEVTPIGGEQSDNGISTSLQRFVVPRVPAGDYYLYFFCLDSSACCEPLEPTFGVLAAPDTSTVSAHPSGSAVPWQLLSISFALGGAMAAHRLRSRRAAPH